MRALIFRFVFMLFSFSHNSGFLYFFLAWPCAFKFDEIKIERFTVEVERSTKRMKNHISMQICAIKYRKIKSFDSYGKYQSGTLTEIAVNIYFRDLGRNNIQYWVITGRIFVAIYLLTNVLTFSYTWFSPCPNHKSCFLIFFKAKM